MLRWAALALLLVASAGAAAWWGLARRPPKSATGIDLGSLAAGVSRQGLNLLIVTLDTTRADRIGAYGALDVETPAVDALAREGVQFDQAVSVAPLTLPVHSSIFTGKFPPEHGVRDNGGFFLDAKQTTLAEVLKARGYRTGGFIAAYVLDSKWGISQGFDTYFDDFDLSDSKGLSLGSIQRPGNEVVDKALPWIQQAKDVPFFAWIHLYDAHSPYRPPEPFATKYKAHPYNGEVAFADSQLGRVIAQLKALGLYERTVIVVMGDHGESLGDHGEASHGFFIYNSVTHVPFVIRAPFSLTRSRHVADPVRSVDVMPTVLDLLGVPSPAGISGASLVPLMTGSVLELGLDAYSESLYPLHHYGWSDLRALRAGRYKVIDAPRPELYDVDQDPGEATNLYQQRRSLGDGMIAQLRAMENRFQKTEAAMPAEDVDPEARARLAALGYVGSFVANASDPRTGRADPKDKIGLFNKLGEVTALTKEREAVESEPFDQIVGLLNDVLREDPQVIDAWFMMGSVHLRHAKPELAVKYFTHTLSLKPDYDLAVINLAQAYRQLGDDDAALAGFERYLQLDPTDAFVRYQIGEIWLDRGDVAKAEQLFLKALELGPHVAAAKNALGVIALGRGDVDGAERLIQAAIAIKPKVRLAHYNLALIAEKRGDLPGAEREYVEELKQHPESYKAAFNLSRLYEQVGDREGQIEALKASIKSNPRFPEGHFFLAKAYLDGGTNVAEAAQLARKGLELGPKSEHAALGHYVLADIYNRQGRGREAAQEAALGRALEARK
ncbi:MAG: sulfatase-like hydrolase/transferase [Acidobacteria bacterium]|nr:sulfatase-like hydrolase/transferase [Acidobacteriota bacterium]